MKDEIIASAINSVEKVVVTDDMICSINRSSNIIDGRRIDYYYDDAERCICKINRKDGADAPFTYIAKSEIYDGVYKVGLSSDIGSRMKSLRYDNGVYGKLRLSPIAFHELCLESLVLFELSGHSRREGLPRPLSSVDELLFVSREDIDKLIDGCGFTRCDENTLPLKNELVVKTFYNQNGYAFKTSYINSYIDFRGDLVTKTHVFKVYSSGEIPSWPHK